MPATRLYSDTEFTAHAPDKSNVRLFVCFLLFLATTINYMDRSVFSLIEPQLHLGFMGWIPGVDAKYQVQYHLNYGHVIEWFQIAYGVGFLFAGRVIDKLGTKTGYALAILIWGCASLSHSLVTSVAGTIGPEGNLRAPGPASCRRIVLPYPVIDNDEVAKILNIDADGDKPGFKAVRVLRSYYEDTGEDAFLMQYKIAEDTGEDVEETNRIAQYEEN